MNTMAISAKNIIIGIVALSIIGCGSSDTKYETTASATTEVTPVKEWYQGGTLHGSNVSEWKSASHENKLATAGDILAATVWKDAITSQSDMDELKSEAESLIIDIDTATMDGGIVDNMSVSSIAAMIIPQRNDFGPTK